MTFISLSVTVIRLIPKYLKLLIFVFNKKQVLYLLKVYLVYFVYMLVILRKSDKFTKKQLFRLYQLMFR